MKINPTLKPCDLRKPIERFFGLAVGKVRGLDRAWDSGRGAPVFTVRGRYTTRAWTQWTQGFQFGCIILTADATEDQKLYRLGRQRTIEHMLPHVTHTGVHDHAFNNLSTYGNLRRLVREGKVTHDPWEERLYDTAICCSGAVQAARWSTTYDGMGYIYSFNGPHSLFVDTMRTLRILGLAHRLGHVLMGENDDRINLLGRLIWHGLTSARYLIWYGTGRDAYDRPETRGRTAHEAIFNTNDSQFRCPVTQQGYSPFSTWTRGLAWAMLGFCEQLEFLKAYPPSQVKVACGMSKSLVTANFERAARATCDFYITQATAQDGVCYWDTGAPGLVNLDEWRARPAEPFNDHEPVDSSASAIAAQGLLRFGRYLGQHRGRLYTQAGLSVARTLLGEPYLSTKRNHQGLLLHTVYHRPNGWDYIPRGRKVPCGESSMWGDYHLIELAYLIKRLDDGGPYPTFFEP